ncbi:MAG: ABC transporter permease [Candidatus Omnitrophica bacterium]|nr:ABC transporter permease [Candidatus Omnitrophota bacterium]
MFSEKVVLDYSTPKTLCIKLNGDWLITESLPEAGEILAQLNDHKEISQLTCDLSKMGEWNSVLIAFLLHLAKGCKRRNIQFSHQGSPQGINKLLSLALKIDDRVALVKVERIPFLEKVADGVLHCVESMRSLLSFLGEVALAFYRLITGKVYFRRDDFFGIVQRCGADALMLISLISVLTGVILAFIGAMQLKLFGAQIYIADIVGIGMVRVMGAMMTGILMAGRTGASFAAELGLMQTNEEIDALKTLGISPVEFLVTPRILALVIMIPLLTLYADAMGILGGFAISTGLLGLNPVEYWHHTQSAVKLSNLWIGLVHSFVFGLIIAIAGCYRGIKCARSASAVGEATTSAVVTAITSIVIATAVITFVCQILGV